MNAGLGDHGPIVPACYLTGLLVHLSSGQVNSPVAMHTVPGQHVGPDQPGSRHQVCYFDSAPG